MWPKQGLQLPEGGGFGAPANTSASNLATGCPRKASSQAHTSPAGLVTKERFSRLHVQGVIHPENHRQPAGCVRFNKSNLGRSLTFSTHLSDSVALASLEGCESRSNESVTTSNTCPYFVYSIDISLHLLCVSFFSLPVLFPF